MDRETILILADCELKRLPLDRVEAFVLSQVDGRLTLEEIGAIAGLDVDKTLRLATRLAELGAVAPAERPPSDRRREKSAGPRSERRPPRQDSRTAKISGRGHGRTDRPPSSRDARAERSSQRVDPRAERPSVRLDLRKEEPRPDSRRGRARSSKSMRAAPAVNTRSVPPVDDAVCDLDEVTLARITSLEAKLGTLDHYALLEIERTAEKRDVKRAYFAMASKFHPDRFFGKKLGRMRTALDRIFMRITEAHDVLSTPALRAPYDATLPKPSPPSRRERRRLSSATSKAQASTPAPRKPTTKRMKAASRSAIAAAKTSAPPSSRGKRLPAAHAEAKPPETTTPAHKSEPAPRHVRAAAKQLEEQKHIDVFLLAAEEALRADDLIGAANNYRLALQVREDPFVRQRFEATDTFAKTRRYEQSLTRARAAERDQRWADAAAFFSKAHEARPEASLAERAAHALRMSGGDLRRAVALAEQAVSRDPKNAAYHVTLGEVCLAANLVVRASAEAARALELAPKHPGAVALAASISKKKES